MRTIHSDSPRADQTYGAFTNPNAANSIRSHVYSPSLLDDTRLQILQLFPVTYFYTRSAALRAELRLHTRTSVSALGYIEVIAAELALRQLTLKSGDLDAIQLKPTPGQEMHTMHLRSQSVGVLGTLSRCTNCLNWYRSEALRKWDLFVDSLNNHRHRLLGTELS